MHIQQHIVSRKKCVWLMKFYNSTELPSAPQNFKETSIIDDPREGFLGHAVITFEWELPEQSQCELFHTLSTVFIHISSFCTIIGIGLEGYRLTVTAIPLANARFRDTCGSSFTAEIDKVCNSHKL